METSIRVAIVDDQQVICEGLASLLSLKENIEVVGTATDGRQALDIVDETEPDVVLMDVQMPGMNGIAAAREIQVRHPLVKVLILTTFNDNQYVYEALQCNVDGYLLKTADSERLAESIRSIYEGRTVLDSAVTRSVVERMVALANGEPAEPVLCERLTDREREVLQLMADGRANAEIADTLSLAVGTVKNHVSHVLAKLQARDRAHAARLASEWGLLH